MIRKLLAFAILLVVVLWIVLSYLPRTWVALPEASFIGSWIDPFFPQLAAAGVAILVLIQILIIRGTLGIFRPSQQGPNEQHGEPAGTGSSSFKLSPSAELFWTALPLAMTIALAVAGYQLWLDLSSR